MTVKGWLRDLPMTGKWVSASLWAVLAASGCGRTEPEAAVGIDTAAIIGPYAPQAGDDGEAATPPPATRRQRVHFLTRRVRHRHAGPR
jgi:hypothetical protein